MNAVADQVRQWRFRLGQSGTALSKQAKHEFGAKTVINLSGLPFILFAAFPDSGAALPPIPKYLQNRPEELWVREGDDIVRAPQEDVEVARAYAYCESRQKGEIHGGQRITIMTARTEYRTGEEIRVIHVLEASEAGHELWVMGPKRIQEEYIDGKLSSPPRSPASSYDGMVLQSPGVNFNYDITAYIFTKPGVHTVLWKGGEYFGLDPGLTSNLLQVEVKERNAQVEYDRSYRSAFLGRLSQIKVGYTEEQVLHSAGKPDSYGKGTWCYKWSEPNGGLYDQFCFTIDNGVVTKIGRTSGCEAVY